MTGCTAGRTRRILTAAVAGMGVAGCAALQPPRPVEVRDPDSPCARLQRSYTVFYGLLVFADSVATERTMPFCLPATRGAGILGYNLEIAVPREGPVSVAFIDPRPEVRFGAYAIHGSCAGDNTGKSSLPLGTGTEFGFDGRPGTYCVSYMTERPRDQDVWVTIVVRRP